VNYGTAVRSTYTEGFQVLGRFSSSEFHEPSARDARRRIVDLFDTHLKA
jgi:hypothetical protein